MRRRIRQARHEEPQVPAGAKGIGQTRAPEHGRLGQHQTDLFAHFAGKRLERRLVGVAATAGKIPLRGMGQAGLVVAQRDEQPCAQKQRALGAVDGASKTNI